MKKYKKDSEGFYQLAGIGYGSDPLSQLQAATAKLNTLTVSLQQNQAVWQQMNTNITQCGNNYGTGTSSWYNCVVNNPSGDARVNRDNANKNIGILTGQIADLKKTISQLMGQVQLSGTAGTVGSGVESVQASTAYSAAVAAQNAAASSIAASNQAVAQTPGGIIDTISAMSTGVKLAIGAGVLIVIILISRKS